MGNFPDILKELRRLHPTPQSELAQALGVSRSTISMYECGEREPNFEILKKIADYYRVDLNDLLGYEPKLSNPPVSYEPTFDDLKSFMKRSSKKLTAEEKQQLILLLLQ